MNMITIIIPSEQSISILFTQCPPVPKATNSYISWDFPPYIHIFSDTYLFPSRIVCPPVPKATNSSALFEFA